jgi:2-dehydro-3-deoxyphosphogluconate aldolase/(4S)-4-hydroxy-2-oxoglutarate aldolase
MAVLAGARLLVTPTLVEDVIEIGQRYGVATVIGCSSATELLRATTLGADLVKVFPASLWTPRALSDLLQALPQLECVPTGGIAPDEAADWIEAGAVAVGIGSGLTRGNDPAARVRTLLEAIERARSRS